MVSFSKLGKKVPGNSLTRDRIFLVSRQMHLAVRNKWEVCWGKAPRKFGSLEQLICLGSAAATRLKLLDSKIKLGTMRKLICTKISFQKLASYPIILSQLSFGQKIKLLTWVTLSHRFWGEENPLIVAAGLCEGTLFFWCWHSERE